MFETKGDPKNRVQAIKFKTIDEDYRNCKFDLAAEREPQFASIKNDHDGPGRGEVGACRCGHGAREQSRPPTVLLENVCFSVDKSQQQANFLREVLFRLGDCMNPILRGPLEKDERRVEILKSVNLNVPPGSIFGLLGPSSCGKTTLLRCLVGLLKPSSGSIRLFGVEPARKDADRESHCKQASRANKSSKRAPPSVRSNRALCKVPGANVGYMPQDLGLYEDFTIKQLLTMFGRYMRMESKLIESRILFMADFLELPDVGRQIYTLSGGQKRRVSFAIACLHMPPLIILDEPTVGVDPLLRQSIWKYLRRLASEESKTIIITTHYIEEAAQADQVALMRAGSILVQDTPARIMALNQSRSLEEAFLKICNNVESDTVPTKQTSAAHKLFPQRPIKWNELDSKASAPVESSQAMTRAGQESMSQKQPKNEETVMNEPKLSTEQKLALYDKLKCSQESAINPQTARRQATETGLVDPIKTGDNYLSMIPNACHHTDPMGLERQIGSYGQSFGSQHEQVARSRRKKLPFQKKNKFTVNDSRDQLGDQQWTATVQNGASLDRRNTTTHTDHWRNRVRKSVALFYALLYKNYRRNVNSLPLLVFQFLLPMIQMISFSLCVGGRPTNIGLGIVNLDQAPSFVAESPATFSFNESSTDTIEYYNDTLSSRFLSFLDGEMLNTKPYDNLQEALWDVRRAKLWAVLEIGQNFTSAISQRFDLDNFYQLDTNTIAQSLIRIYPDRSNKILDMICHRSLVDSYRKFLSSEFEHFKRLPIEVARPIFDIKPNIISNSIDGYTESIAPGLLASLTYIMAAGLTTFIMVVERGNGILERTYTIGINPVVYLLAHAIFRSLVMMLQIGAVLVLTFYVLKQPLVGSIGLAYLQLMVLNITGISYGLLISSIVADQNGAALTIVSSLVVKITMSGILWPFEAIPRWLRFICYIQPLTMPVQALKGITLKGDTLGDRSVNLGLLVSLTWLLIFLTISTRRFKFYQH